MSESEDLPAHKARRHRRSAVQIDVSIVGVLKSFEACIADLSEGGALVTGGSLPAKARCEIHFAGQIIYGLVMWSEIDRMGIRFPFELRDGPLHQRLVIARGYEQARPHGLLPPTTIFGRRGL